MKEKKRTNRHSLVMRDERNISHTPEKPEILPSPPSKDYAAASSKLWTILAGDPFALTMETRITLAITALILIASQALRFKQNRQKLHASGQVKHESVWWIRMWREWHFAQCRHCGLWLTKDYITYEYNNTCRACRNKYCHP